MSSSVRTICPARGYHTVSVGGVPAVQLVCGVRPKIGWSSGRWQNRAEPPPNDFTDPTTPITTQPDTAVRINLRVLYNPTPDARGRAEIHALSLARTVSLQ